jgi:hypothetical protein
MMDVRRLSAKSQQYMLNLARMRLALLDVISNQKANQDADQVFHVRRLLLAPQTATPYVTEIFDA